MSDPNEQARRAVQLVNGLFAGHSAPAFEEPPPGSTVESLWAEVVSLRREINGLRRAKRGVRPKVEDAARLLLEDAELAELPIATLAEIIRKTFSRYGIPCSCSETSVRWYMSQRNLQWNIVPRRVRKVEVVTDDDTGDV